MSRTWLDSPLRNAKRRRGFLIQPIVRRWLPIAAVGLCLTPLGAGQATPNLPEKPVDFNREVRPILSDNCFTCHGPEEKSRQGNLSRAWPHAEFTHRVAPVTTPETGTGVV